MSAFRVRVEYYVNENTFKERLQLYFIKNQRSSKQRSIIYPLYKFYKRYVWLEEKIFVKSIARIYVADHKDFINRTWNISENFVPTISGMKDRRDVDCHNCNKIVCRNSCLIYVSCLYIDTFDIAYICTRIMPRCRREREGDLLS